MFDLFKKNSVVDEFKTQLRDKYDEEFMIEEIYNIHYADLGKGFQVLACPVNNPTLKFHAYMTNDYHSPYDTYLCTLMQEKVQEEIIRIADIYFFGEFWLQAVPHTFHFESAINANEKNKYIGVREFFKQEKEEIHLSIELYIKSNHEPDCTREAERLFRFTEEVSSFGVHDCEVLVYYVKPEDFEEMLVDYEQYIQDKRDYQELFGKVTIPDNNIYMHYPENFPNTASFQNMITNAFTTTNVEINHTSTRTTKEEIHHALIEGLSVKNEV